MTCLITTHITPIAHANTLYLTTDNYWLIPQANRHHGNGRAQSKPPEMVMHTLARLGPSSPWLYSLSPGHIRHPSAVWAVCRQFTAENRGDHRMTLRVPQGVGLNRRGRGVENQWSRAVERFANMFANQSTVHVCSTDIC